ncbi:DUF4184 family protein [Inediibacterium massiliense]|uniref:DUF4184 family protein n=1 Tax=Inediibacterium massiliense TaxID=1658111 RepID=UPI0006B5606E|nr:DUF4184 family protein [Inediibacterium massiliense]
MPFTFSHPAIVLPIKDKYTKYFNLTALILGSMAPDFEYFLKFRPIRTIGHSLLGFFVLNLPLCFIFAYLFHMLIKKSFIMSLPTPLDRWYSYIAYEKWRLSSINEYIIFVYSSLLGMISHVLWDGFTHGRGFFVQKISLLTKNIVIMNHFIPVYKLLQHGSTFLGFFIILFYIYQKRRFKNYSLFYWSTKRKLFYYSFIFMIAVLFLLGRISLMDQIHIFYIGTYIVTFIDGIIIGMMVFSILNRTNRYMI